MLSKEMRVKCDLIFPVEMEKFKIHVNLNEQKTCSLLVKSTNYKQFQSNFPKKKDSNCLVTSTKPKKLITRITQNAVFAEIVVKC